MEHKKYARLLNEFMLQPKPYVSIADSLDTLYQRFLYSTNLSKSQVAPFDFTLLRTPPIGKESFRWILGYDEQKANNILRNKEVFSNFADSIFSTLKEEPETLYYKKVLANPSKFSDVEFLTVVFHLTYRFSIPADTFAVGLIHREHKKKKAKFYQAELDLKICDSEGVPYVRIDNNQLQPQVLQECYAKEGKIFHSFLHEWVSVIQGFDLAHRVYNFPYNVYFPVYDSDFPAQRALRGYLGIFCSQEAFRNMALEYFGHGENRNFREINDAYKKGVCNHIVDSFNAWQDEGAVIDWWVDSIHRLHQWGTIELVNDPECKRDELFWIESQKRESRECERHICKISIRQLLERNPIAGFVAPSLLEMNADKILSMTLPFEVISNHHQSIQSPILKERVQDIVGLLDALIRKRHLLVNEEKIKNSARKSAVASVMSRNMSHNIGSHVLAKLSTSQDFPNRIGWDYPKKITALNSYLRTRMDFIAAVSTSGPSVTTSLRLYRDVMAYFKPVYKDQSEFMWQELLLDYISGIEDLKSEGIEVTLLRNRKKLDLESPVRDLDPSFACPNGILGTHAFYIIVENIIRNSAKHAFRKGTHKKLEITIGINDYSNNEEFIEICIYDNLQNAEKKSVGRKGSTVTEFINTQINQSILNPEGNLRGEAWGLLEMKVCAAYLRKLGCETVDDPFDLPLLEAVSKSGNLGYKFYLHKPNQVLLVDDSRSITLNANISGLQSVTLADFKRKIKSNVPHQFLVLVEPAEPVVKLVKKYKKSLPIRIFTTNRQYTEYAFINLDELKYVVAEPKACELSITRTLWKHWADRIALNVALFIRSGDQGVVTKWRRLSSAESEIEPDKIKNLNSDNSYVVLDRHGEIQKNFAGELDEKFSSGKVIYYQQLQQQQPTNNIITHLTEDRQVGERLMYSLIETGATKVLILDERIQKLSEDIKDNFDDNLALKSRLERMNIFIPPKEEIDLDNPNSCHSALRRWLNENLKDAMFLLVHFGILEKLYRYKTDRMQRRLDKIEEAFPRVNVVLISGRGLPEPLTKLEARFLNYSQVARYVLEEISKYHLNKVLFAARRYQSWTNHS